MIDVTPSVGEGYPALCTVKGRWGSPAQPPQRPCGRPPRLLRSLSVT